MKLVKSKWFMGLAMLVIILTITFVFGANVSAAPLANYTPFADDFARVGDGELATDSQLQIVGGNGVTAGVCTIQGATYLEFDLATLTGNLTDVNDATLTLQVASITGLLVPGVPAFGMAVELYGIANDGLWSEGPGAILFDDHTNTLTPAMVSLNSKARISSAGQVVFPTSQEFTDFIDSQTNTTADPAADGHVTIVIKPDPAAAQGCFLADGFVPAVATLDSKETLRAPNVAPVLAVAGIGPTSVNLLGTDVSVSQNTMVALVAVIGLLLVTGFVVVNRRKSEEAA
jgi:hypothetical protein